MDPIDEVIAAIESSRSGERLSYRKAADCFSVNYTTLLRRRKECQAPRDTLPANLQLLNNEQELELVTYIRDLTEDGLPPTKAMVRNFASEIAGKRVGEGWVTCFIHRNKQHLVAK
jgi:hypothetical protein